MSASPDLKWHRGIHGYTAENTGLEYTARTYRTTGGWMLRQTVYGGPLDTPRVFATLADAKTYAGYCFHAAWTGAHE